MDKSTEPPLHIAILPWLAFGHMIPFFHLAVALATAGLRISFISTPRNTTRLPKPPNHLSSLITFINLPLPPVDDLPENAEATLDVSFAETQYLKIAYDSLKNSIKSFIEQESPDWILHDFLPYWVVDIAREHSVRCVFFSVYSAAVVAFLGPPETMTEDGRSRWWPSPESMTAKPEWVPFPSAVAFRLAEAEVFYHGALKANASGVSDMERFRLSVEMCSVVAVRSCNEYEGEYLELLQKLYRKPVIPIGLLPPPLPETPPISEESKFRGWLDMQNPKSVVFVSFGSEYKLSENELLELAYGLELSNVPFLWALRRPEDEEALPRGFMDRTRGRGIVSFGWAPQLEILAHPSVGGSLFHSGWGSIIETLRYGHALVLLPFIIDQSLNARLLVEKGLAIEVERDDDGSFNRNKIASSLVKAMMTSEEGKEMMIKAREMGAIFAEEELHGRYIRGFVEYLLKHGKKSDT